VVRRSSHDRAERRSFNRMFRMDSLKGPTLLVELLHESRAATRAHSVIDAS
jgi:hypothetical protein